MQKIILTFLFFFAASSIFAQGVKTFAAGTPERKAVMDVLRGPVQSELNVPVQFVVNKLNVSGDFVFLVGVPQQKDGKAIDYTKSRYKEQYNSGAFDDGIVALLKRSGSSWKILSYEIGSTDVPYTCWWKQFKAPKEIFDGAADDNCE
jgi:hypothetical protein